jgi:hypothetical protein
MAPATKGTRAFDIWDDFVQTHACIKYTCNYIKMNVIILSHTRKFDAIIIYGQELTHIHTPDERSGCWWRARTSVVGGKFYDDDEKWSNQIMYAAALFWTCGLYTVHTCIISFTLDERGHLNKRYKNTCQICGSNK